MESRAALLPGNLPEVVQDCIRKVRLAGDNRTIRLRALQSARLCFVRGGVRLD
jgi:hypothetical protein